MRCSWRKLLVARSIRLRAHVEAPTAEDVEPEVATPTTKRPLAPRAAHFVARRSFFLHVVVDELDRAVAFFFRETFDGWTRREGIAVPDGTNPTSEVLAWAKAQRQGLRRGIVAYLDVLTFSELGLLIVKRCYRHGVPLVGWDIPWQLCRLAGHVGRSVGGAFSVALMGTGKVVDGKWRDSDYCPRLRVTTRGSGNPAFIRWLAPRDETAMPKGHRPQFVDLRNLVPSVAGGAVETPAQAAVLLATDWPMP